MQFNLVKIWNTVNHCCCDDGDDSWCHHLGLVGQALSVSSLLYHLWTAWRVKDIYNFLVFGQCHHHEHQFWTRVEMTEPQVPNLSCRTWRWACACAGRSGGKAQGSGKGDMSYRSRDTNGQHECTLSAGGPQVIQPGCCWNTSSVQLDRIAQVKPGAPWLETAQQQMVK